MFILAVSASENFYVIISLPARESNSASSIFEPSLLSTEQVEGNLLSFPGINPHRYRGWAVGLGELPPVDAERVLLRTQISSASLRSLWWSTGLP